MAAAERIRDGSAVPAMARFGRGPHGDGHAVHRRRLASTSTARPTLARWLQEQGNEGLVVAGTTGESPTLTDAEKLHAVGGRRRRGDDPGHRRVDRQPTPRTPCTSPPRRPSSASPAMLALCPYYNRPSQAGIEGHLRAVAEATDLPGRHLRHPGPHRPQGLHRRCSSASPTRSTTSSASRTPPATRPRRPASSPPPRTATRCTAATTR